MKLSANVLDIVPDEGQCSIQIKIASNKLRIIFSSEKEHTNVIINFLNQLFYNNEAARVPNDVLSYNIEGDYGRVWLVLSPDEALNENGRFDFWFPAQALNEQEIDQLIKAFINPLNRQGFDVPRVAINTIKKREYWDIFPETLVLTTKDLAHCLHGFFMAVDELADQKGFVLNDKAIGKQAPTKNKARHSGYVFFGLSTTENTDSTIVNTSAPTL